MGDEWRTYFERIDFLISCPVVDVSNKQVRIIGTATQVLPGVFLTATHLVQDWHDKSTRTRGRDVTLLSAGEEGDFKILVYQLLKDGSVAVWRPDSILLAADEDIAILVDQGNYNEKVAELLKAGAYPHIGYDLHYPKVGDHIIAMGYPETVTAAGDKEGAFSHAVRPEANSGIIEEFYSNGAGLVKGPCFQSDVRAPGGMSGGPVFNSKNLICGIVSAGYDPTDELPFYTTIISSIAHLFTATLSSVMLGGGDKSLIQLAKEGYLHLEGAEHLIEKDGGYVWQEYAEECAFCTSAPENGLAVA